MKLSEIKKTIKVEIPDSDNLVVYIKTTMPWYDQMELSGIADETERGKFLLWKMIDSWNLVDDNGEVVPITKEVVDSFNAKIMMPLFKAIQDIVSEQEKKKSNWRKIWSFISKK